MAKKNTMRKLSPGMFSPSRLKTLQSCKWQYELKYNRKIYPTHPIIEPHSELGSAMHYVAEHYKPAPDGNPNHKLAQYLTDKAKETFTLEKEQLPELDFMIGNLINNIWPSLEGKGEDRFTPSHVETEANIRGDAIFNDSQGPVKIPLNMKIDRLVNTEDGRTIIMDYKKGQMSVTRHMFQLLFYVTCYSQRTRQDVNNIEIWLIFPNEKKQPIQKVKGGDLIDEIPSFDEEMKELIDELWRQEENGGYTEQEATPSFLCNFCPFQATPLCPTSMVLHGAENPENAEREFIRTRYENRKKITETVDPKQELSDSGAW